MVPLLLYAWCRVRLASHCSAILSPGLDKRLRITAGIYVLIQRVPDRNNDRYKAKYSFYFGDYRYISVQELYLTYEEYLAMRSRSGVFEEARGTPSWERTGRRTGSRARGRTGNFGCGAATERKGTDVQDLVERIETILLFPNVDMRSFFGFDLREDSVF